MQLKIDRPKKRKHDAYMLHIVSLVYKRDLSSCCLLLQVAGSTKALMTNIAAIDNNSLINNKTYCYLKYVTLDL